MEDYDIENLAECRADAFGNIVRWDEPHWINRNVTTEKRPMFELCSNAEEEAGPSFFLFPEEFDFFFYASFCQNLGGKIPFSLNEEGYHELMDTLEDIVVGDIHEKCMHASGNLITWVGVTDEEEEGIWADPITKEPMPFDGFWEAGQPNGGGTVNCARTYIDRRWTDEYCDSK